MCPQISMTFAFYFDWNSTLYISTCVLNFTNYLEAHALWFSPTWEVFRLVKNMKATSTDKIFVVLKNINPELSTISFNRCLEVKAVFSG